MAESSLSVCSNSAKNASKCILRGDLKTALKNLSLTKEGGMSLEKILDSILMRLEDLERYNKSQQKELFGKLQYFQSIEQELRDKICSNSKEREISGKEAAIQNAK